MALQREAAAVQHQLGALADAQRDVVLHPLAVGGADYGAVLGLGVGGDADAQGLDLGEQALAQGLGGARAHGTATGRAMQRSPAEP